MTSTADPAVSPVTAAVRATLAALGRGVYAVACSGGADSIALADAAIAVAGPSHVVVLVIDHGLGPESARVTDEVVAWARGQGAAALAERVVVPRRASLEAAAREVRYAALERLADRVGATAVLLGHTARDQAETVLMRILRGTGPAGLAGIPARRGRFVRPLLALPRAAIDAYVAARGLPTWADPMNDDPAIARVRVRQRVLPLLRAENPRVDAALVRLADSAAEWLAVVDAAAAPLAGLPLDCAALAAQPPAIRKRAVSLALEHAGIDHDATHLAAIDRVVCADARGEVAIDLPGARLVRSYDRLALAGEVGPPPALVAPAGPYVLRRWEPGDRMRPARLRGRSRKLSDLYIDAKIPRALRAIARVVVRTTDGTIVWAEHLGTAFAESDAVVPMPSKWAGVFE